MGVDSPSKDQKDTPFIWAQGLTRTYKTFSRQPGVWGAVRDLFRGGGDTITALDGFNISIQEGELVGLIGPNGSGKSTTVKLLCGILAPTAGELQVAGLSPSRNRREHVRNIGVVFGQRTQLWWDLAVREAFSLLGTIYGVPDSTVAERIRQFDEVLGIGDFLGTPVRELSLGQRMRCDICAALLHAPPLLFLDEPTIGLDLVAKQRLRAFIKHINETKNTTVILTTHDLDDVETLCSRILLIDQGQLLFDGSITDLQAQAPLNRTAVFRFSQPLPASTRDKLQPSEALTCDWSDLDHTPTLTIQFNPMTRSPGELVGQIAAHAQELGVGLADLSIHEAPIEELVGHLYRNSPGWS